MITLDDFIHDVARYFITGVYHYTPTEAFIDNDLSRLYFYTYLIDIKNLDDYCRFMFNLHEDLSPYWGSKENREQFMENMKSDSFKEQMSYNVTSLKQFYD